jgi:lysophospholipase L1-like esterase
MAKLKMIVKVLRYLKDIWLILGISLLLFAVAEGALSFIYLIWDHFTASDVEMFDRRVQADDFRTVPWAKDYFKEFNESVTPRWESYVYWRRKPYQGAYITINADGLRITPGVESGPVNERPPLRVFMFGGSTMWGTGARDLFTIPALLATELKNRGIKVDVVNFGESGYVNTQEIIALLLQLQKGNIPDLVVFYDGVNDTYSGYQQGIAGLPQNEFNRVKEFNITKRLPEFKGMIVKEAIKNLATVRFMNGVLRKIGMKKPEQYDEPHYDEGRIAGEMVRRYLNNLEIVKSLAASYHFKVRFYWQPTIFGKTKLSGYEKAEYERKRPVEKIFKETGNILRERTAQARDTKVFQDLSAIFSDLDEPVYIDWAHLSERGNAIVAHAMAEQLLPLVQSGRDAPAVSSGLR